MRAHLVVAEPRRTRVLVHLRLLERLRLHDAREQLPHIEELAIVHILRRLVFWVLQGTKVGRQHLQQVLGKLYPASSYEHKMSSQMQGETRQY